MADAAASVDYSAVGIRSLGVWRMRKVAVILIAALLVGGNVVQAGLYRSSAERLKEDHVDAVERANSLASELSSAEAQLSRVVATSRRLQKRLDAAGERLQTARKDASVARESARRARADAADAREELVAASAAEPAVEADTTSSASAATTPLYRGSEVVEWVTDERAAEMQSAGLVMCEPADYDDPNSRLDCWYPGG